VTRFPRTIEPEQPTSTVPMCKPASQPPLPKSWSTAAAKLWNRPLVLLMLLTAGCTPADPLNILTWRGDWDVTSSIPYANGPRHALDVYAPRRAANAPVIVFFYGGNWQYGHKEMYRFVAAALAARGYVTIVPDYRVYPDVFPAFLEDGALAVAWARQNAARFGGNPAITDMILVNLAPGKTVNFHSGVLTSVAGVFHCQQASGPAGLQPTYTIEGSFVENSRTMF